MRACEPDFCDECLGKHSVEVVSEGPWLRGQGGGLGPLGPLGPLEEVGVGLFIYL